MAKAKSSGPIPHLIWTGKSWKVKPNMRAPIVKLKYRISADGYVAAGRQPPIHSSEVDPKIPFTATCDALADTGCTTMIAGLLFVHNLGLKKSDLVPVHTQIRAANRSEIKIIGAIIVEIKLHAHRGKEEILSKWCISQTSSTEFSSVWRLVYNWV